MTIPIIVREILFVKISWKRYLVNLEVHKEATQMTLLILFANCNVTYCFLGYKISVEG